MRTWASKFIWVDETPRQLGKAVPKADFSLGAYIFRIYSKFFGKTTGEVVGVFKSGFIGSLGDLEAGCLFKELFGEVESNTPDKNSCGLPGQRTKLFVELRPAHTQFSV